MQHLFDVREGERRVTLSAFFTLFGVTAAHTLLETTRDALFILRAPIALLPVLYIALAAIGLVSARVSARWQVPARLDPVRIALCVGAVVAAGFWLATRTPLRPILYALYLWTGFFASWVSGALWARLADQLSVVQAKRLFGIVGTGAVLGAVGGAAMARACVARFDVRHLLVIAAGVLLTTAFATPRTATTTARSPGLVTRAAQARDEAMTPDGMLAILRDRYCGRLVAIVGVTAMVGTMIDFAFKAGVAATISDPRDLAELLATVSLVTNLGSLAAQLVGVRLALRVLGVQRSLYVMPVLIGLASWSPLALRGIDATLRQSLQRTTIELLSIPLSSTLRARAKSILDLVGQRGGQALAASIIFALTYSASRGVLVRFFILGLALVWLALAWSIRDRYLELFRHALRRGRVEIGTATLDLATVETALGALGSGDTSRVIGALDVLGTDPTARFIPSSVLYHPSPVVILHALDLLTRAGRTDLDAADALLAHADPGVRLAALRARSAEIDTDKLSAIADDADARVRSTARAIASAGDVRIDRYLALLHDRSACVQATLALAPLGDEALARIEAALDAPSTPAEIRSRLVGVLARMRCDASLRCLLRRAASRSPDTCRLLRALRQRDVALAGERVPLERLALEALATAERMATFRLAQEALGAGHAGRRTAGYRLVDQHLRDAENDALDAVFLVLGLLHPQERIARIQRGLASPELRASSLELLDNVLVAPLRDRMLAFVDDGPRVPHAVGRDYATLLAAMHREGDGLARLAQYHREELGLGDPTETAPETGPAWAAMERA